MGIPIKEIVIFTLVSLSSIFILGYSIHMFVGGLVSENTEIFIITIACIIGLLIISYMAWDIIKMRIRTPPK
ncbi:MAG: hypothetical protein GXP19_07685 [Gammaproteobacteria bacterium]|nr:hypothetical protein [Gammaproteobacteria bacterium]